MDALRPVMAVAGTYSRSCVSWHFRLFFVLCFLFLPYLEGAGRVRSSFALPPDPGRFFSPFQALLLLLSSFHLFRLWLFHPADRGLTKRKRKKIIVEAILVARGRGGKENR